MAESRERLFALIDNTFDRHIVERAFAMALFESQEVLRLLNATEVEAQVYGRLATSVIHAGGLRRAAPGIIERNRLGQPGLWRFGISGDLPIVLVRIGDVRRIDLVKQALQAHAYWRIKGLAADLVIINEDFSGYAPSYTMNHRPGERGPEVTGGNQAVSSCGARRSFGGGSRLFLTVARVVFADTVETFAEQVQRRVPPERMPRALCRQRLR